MVTRAKRMRVGLATCSALPGLDEETQKLAAALSARGLDASPLVWSDPTSQELKPDLVVVRSCWDYIERRSDFLVWAHSLRHVANPAEILEWNTDKRYLLDLDKRGVPVARTRWIEPGTQWDVAESGHWVVKPAVGIAALGAGRYDCNEAAERALAFAHIARLQACGATVMVQPYLHGIDQHGEISLVFLEGRFSHAVRKRALLKGPDYGIDLRFVQYGGQQLDSIVPREDELALAQSALAAVPRTSEDPLLYARVDLVRDANELVLLELELTEPNLYLQTHELVEQFADVIAKRVTSICGRTAECTT